MLIPSGLIVWKLAPESDPQQRYVVVSADGERELTGIIERRADAEILAALFGLAAAISNNQSTCPRRRA